MLCLLNSASYHLHGQFRLPIWSTHHSCKSLVTLPSFTPHFSTETLFSPLPSNILPFLQSLWRFSWQPHSKGSFSSSCWNSLEFTYHFPPDFFGCLLSFESPQIHYKFLKTALGVLFWTPSVPYCNRHSIILTDYPLSFSTKNVFIEAFIAKEIPIQLCKHEAAWVITF